MLIVTPQMSSSPSCSSASGAAFGPSRPGIEKIGDATLRTRRSHATNWPGLPGSKLDLIALSITSSTTSSTSCAGSLRETQKRTRSRNPHTRIPSAVRASSCRPSRRASWW